MSSQDGTCTVIRQEWIPGKARPEPAERFTVGIFYDKYIEVPWQGSVEATQPLVDSAIEEARREHEAMQNDIIVSVAPREPRKAKQGIRALNEFLRTK